MEKYAIKEGGMSVVCPLCREAMAKQPDFWKCPGCGAELWPDMDTGRQLKETWAAQIAEGRYGNPKGGGGGSKQRRKSPNNPFNRRIPLDV